MPDISQVLFSRLFVESREALRRYVRRLVRSDENAEEIVQEAFLRAYERRDSLVIPRAFLFSTAHNLAADRCRQEHSSPEDVLREFGGSDVEAVTPALDELILAEESSRILKQAIERLPPQQQAALMLRLFHGQSLKEIGSVLGISWTTVKKHIELGTYSVRQYVLARYHRGQ